jgi:hypothetical protein
VTHPSTNATGPGNAFVTVFDLQPDGGGPPVSEYLPAVDGAERVANGRGRYAFSLPETKRDKLRKLLEEGA